MIVVVAPEPVPWLHRIVRELAPLSEARVFEPWLLSNRWPSGRSPAFVQRRQLDWQDVTVHALPGFPAAEVVGRLWARRHTERLLTLRFAQRGLVDRIAARMLPTSTTTVIAPSCAAQRTFAAARRMGAQCVLLEDLPSLRALHRDLDSAAEQHPDCRFLRNYRASPRSVARQEGERLLAHRILVRGAYAASLVAAEGFSPTAFEWREWNTTPAENRRQPKRCVRRILLAGLATGRNGLVEAVQAIENLPEAELLIRAGEGLEPDWVPHHPQVRILTDNPPLDSVDLVIAPAWCESYPPVLREAVKHGIPIAATTQAAGTLQLAPGAQLSVGDVAGLTRVLRNPPAHSTLAPEEAPHI